MHLPTLNSKVQAIVLADILCLLKLHSLYYVGLTEMLHEWNSLEDENAYGAL